MAHTVRPQTSTVRIDGPVGVLEGLVDQVSGVAPTAAAVVCHPHPLYGGAMTNKVVHMLARAFNEVGASAVRFNFRGVGASAGAYDDGVGETEDVLAAVKWAAHRWPGAPLWLAGFSFGGAVAIRAAGAYQVARLVTVAPAIRRVDVSQAALPRCPWLLVQGGADELVEADDVQRWAASLPHPPELKLLPEVDHFFHGRLNLLRDVVVQWIEETSSS